MASINADPRVMEYFPRINTREETSGLIDRATNSFNENGFGLWAVELKHSGEMIGFIGLARPGFEAHFTPCVEVGWRLASAHWGSGYAPEGAEACLEDAFSRLDLAEIVSMTAKINLKSRRVMEKIAMRRTEADDFDHPSLEEGHRLRPHVLYRLTAKEWKLLRRSEN